MRGEIDEKNNLSTEIRLKINEACSKASRLKDTIMGISSKGKITLQKAMPSSLSIESIEKVEKMISSNICEHYFTALTKHAEVKRASIVKMGN